MKSYLRKTPAQMRREAERKRNPQPPSPPPGKIHPNDRVQLASGIGREAEAPKAWLDYVRSGRSPARGNYILHLARPDAIPFSSTGRRSIFRVPYEQPCAPWGC